MLRLVTCSTPETVWQPISASNPGFCLLAVVGNSYLTGLGKSSSSYARSFRRRTLTGEVKARGCQRNLRRIMQVQFLQDVAAMSLIIGRTVTRGSGGSRFRKAHNVCNRLLVWLQFSCSHYGQVSFATPVTGPSPTTATPIVTVPDSPGKQCATPV